MKQIFLVVALFLVSSSLNAQYLELVEPEEVGLSSERLYYTDMAIEKAITESKIPGAVLAIVKGGAMPYLKAYGNKRLFPDVEKMTVNTVFDIASCSKIITAISAMILIEQGKLSLRDDLEWHIHDFNKGQFYNGKRCVIRVQNLLTHSSGLPPYLSITTLKKKYDTLNRENLIDYIANSRRKFVPNSDFKYSCLNFIVLQHIIEKVSEQSLRDFAKMHIFDVLGMEDTDYILLDNYVHLGSSESETRVNLDMVAPTAYCGEDSVLCGSVHDPLANILNGGVSGNAGVFSTAQDLGVLLLTLLNGGEYNDQRILSPLGMVAMSRIPDVVKENGRALGWDANSAYSSNQGDLLSASTLGHTGYTGTSIVIDAENDLAIILLTNSVHIKDYESKDIIRLRTLVANSVAASIIPSYYY